MWKIVDWAGNDVNTGGKTFDTFEDGWDWIFQNVVDEDNAYDDYFVEEQHEKDEGRGNDSGLVEVRQ